MNVLRILLLMVVAFPKLPVRGPNDYAFRWRSAEAIAKAAHGDERLEDELVMIQGYESGFSPHVARCRIKGDRGKSHGAFQLQPIERGHAKTACGEMDEQAELAVEYIRRSESACPGNVGADTLAMFVSGRCTRGLPEAKRRWAPPPTLAPAPAYDFPPM